MQLKQLLLSTILICVNLKNTSSDVIINDNNESEDFRILETGLQEQSFIYGITEAAEKEPSGLCRQHLQRLKQGVRRKESWSIKMIDTSGEEGSGYLFSNTGWLGWKSQCDDIKNNKSLIIQTEQKLPEDIVPPFDIKYVSAYFEHYNSVQIQFRLPVIEYLQLGMCVPTSCANEEIFRLLNQMIASKNLTFLQNYPVKLSLVKVKSPSLENAKLLEFPMAILASIFLTVIFVLTMAGSYYDEIVNKASFHEKEIFLKENIENNNYTPEIINHEKTYDQNKWWPRFLLCFSLPSNARSLFDTNMKTEDSISVIHGLKALGMVIILMVHRPVFNIGALDNVSTLNRFLQQPYSNIFKKSHYSVDTYFCLGGFLISYTFCKAYIGKKHLNFFQSSKLFTEMILHRLIKMIPVYIVMILVGATLWRIIENAYPLYEIFFSSEQSCSKYWWRNLLFITTWYYEWKNNCLIWTWYLSNDMQFYVINCVLLVIGLRYLRFSEIIVKLLIIYSVVYTTWKAYELSYMPTIDHLGRTEIIYYAPFVRLAPYFVGVLAGINFFKWNGILPLTKKNVRNGWLIFTITMIYLIQSLHDPNKSSFEYNAINVGTGRALWAACMSWLLICCLSGNAGIAGKFLSFSGWIPMSRGSFSVYLTNLMVAYVIIYTGDTYEHPAVVKELIGMIGNTVICYIVGMFVSLLLESPIVQLVKLMTTKPKKIEKPKMDENIQNTLKEMCKSEGCKH